jgi:hypothetical protein
MVNKLSIWILTMMATGIVLILANSCKKDDAGPTYKIGQNYGGGIICYLDSTKRHGLICADTDQSSAIPWSNGSDISTGADGAALGTGKANTEAIVAAQGTGNYAAQICNDLILNGYDDWYLPSKSECLNMYFNMKIYNDIGDFADDLYWSSTEASIGNAYSQYSNDGYGPNGGYYKSSSYHVRAVRSF